MQRNSLTLGLLGGLLALAIAHPAPARALNADGSTTGTLQLVNSCNGELVNLVITTHTVARSSSDGSHTTATMDIHGSGVGSFGNNYNFSESNITTDNTNGAQNEFTFIFDLHLISLGSAPNLISQNVTHVTFNADGTPTAQVQLGPTVKCTG